MNEPAATADDAPWKRWQWRAEWVVQAGLETVLCRLPGGLVYRLGALAGEIAWHLVPGRRATVLRNLRIAYAGELDLPALRRIARECFRRTGANLFSAAHTARLTPRQLERVLRIENPELLEQALAGGQGVVLLLAHLSNWEMLSRIVHLFPPGSRTGAFYRPLNNPLLDRRVLDRRQADGTRMFSKHDSPHAAAAFLREGGIVGILADQRVAMLGDVVPFFGRLTRASPLPSLLARRAKAKVLALSLVTTAPGRWVATFVPVAADRSTTSCMSALETAMRPTPEDVFWFQDRWRVYFDTYRPVSEWLGGTEMRSIKPHRAVLWLADAPPDWRPAAAWLHPDVVYEVALASGREVPGWLPEGTVTRAVPHGADRDALVRILAEIDEAQPLPVDYVLTAGAPQALTKACRHAGLRLIGL
jgi:KDO2-lipid IV(A) lauroyltransferase